VRVMGRSVMQPRLVAYMADHSGLSYTYSGSTMIPQEWNMSTLIIKVLFDAPALSPFRVLLQQQAPYLGVSHC
jgi:hypothetical protein